MEKKEFIEKIALFEAASPLSPVLSGVYEDFYFCDEEFDLQFDPWLYDSPVEACLMFYGALKATENFHRVALTAGFDEKEDLAFIENVQAVDTNWATDLQILSGENWSITCNINSPTRAYFASDDIAIQSFLPS